MDMGAIYTAKTYTTEDSYNPRLDSPNGIIAADEDEPTWWQVRFPGQNSIYEVSALTLKKRGDCCKDKVINRIQLEYSTDQGDNWIKYQNGKYFSTGQKPEDDADKEKTIMINPPMRGNTFRVHIDKSNDDPIGGRFDFWVVKIQDSFKKTSKIELGECYRFKSNHGHYMIHSEDKILSAHYQSTYKMRDSIFRTSEVMNNGAVTLESMTHHGKFFVWNKMKIHRPNKKQEEELPFMLFEIKPNDDVPGVTIKAANTN